jgi:protein gp37
MANNSRIEWTEATWNPLTGCTKIGQGCVNCYAERMARRLKAMGKPQYQEVVSDDGHWTNKTR